MTDIESYLKQFGDDKKAIKVFWARNPEVNWTFVVDKNNTVADLLENSQVPDGYYLYLYERKKNQANSTSPAYFVIDQSRKKPSNKLCGATKLQYKPISESYRACSFRT
ncbi:hypothetical protein PPL_05324 [Heterostelium album PN500]|uniref:Uncharacterized protein n=1 Tax=Heterostelium pallidum (strain ATCC 26659 / Pp 5 / PN500) TaxID=670386 RepID=D3BBD4_HETP5|nr:hypothetical protein PPL_05324 [Heterostelium album PN500]EFA81341.1 hypothetical protein PPL_05324 [Heterostelium album PN500]|eukprot:XP_020433459.1 hypothetical protein PPL_05324 [Heterostelium album PN500]